MANTQSEKIGVGIITYNRPEMFKVCIDSIPTGFSELVVVNDGIPYDSSLYQKATHVIQHDCNKGVGVSKNDALKFLMSKGCDHIFLIEDDMKILRDDIFDKYIEASKVTGIQHFNFAYHGPANKRNGTPISKGIISYPCDVKITLCGNLTGALSYFSLECLKECGLLNEAFFNAWEHIEHAYRIIQNGMHPPFWWFADLHESFNYITEQSPTLTQSTYQKGLADGDMLFKTLHGRHVRNISKPSFEDMMTSLRDIKQKFVDNVVES